MAPLRTAVTTAALRRATQRLVSEGGKQGLRMFHRGPLTMLLPAHAGKDYSKVLDTRRDSNEGLIAVEVMTRPVLLSRQHFLPVTESIAGGTDRLKKISNFRWPPQGLRSLGGNQIPACAGANDPTQNKLQK